MVDTLLPTITKADTLQKRAKRAFWEEKNPEKLLFIFHYQKQKSASRQTLLSA
jgi:hypothetical protein